MQRHRLNPLDFGSSHGADYWGLIVVDMTYAQMIRCCDD
jgi:hypothetical protein